MVTTNSNGEHSMPTISADEYKMTQAQKDHGGGTSSIAKLQLRAVRDPRAGVDRSAVRKEMP